MPSERPKVSTRRNKSPRPPNRPLPPTGNNSPRNPSPDSSEDYIDEPKTKSRTGRSRRKRISSSSSEEEVLEVTKSYPSIPASTLASGSTDSPGQICLCQPDPKVPRPRNAFILYRQQSQAAVVQEHPGLSNPEISKIIGEKWRALPEEKKNEWKNLADDEKIRHQKQYPDYRYQPRRAGRNNSTSTGPVESPRCLKCGGRSMTTPQSTPQMPTPATPYRRAVPPDTPSTITGASRYIRHMESPPMATPFSYQSRRSSGPQSPLSPDFKRRRMVNGNYLPARVGNGQLTPYPFPPRGREPLPRPDFMPKGQFAMSAPPRPPHHHDKSLTLPPLKTARLPEEQAKSVEAMVMSIPTVNKVKILTRICPPLAPPGPTSPPQAIRGPLIAIDGADTKAVERVASYLNDCLSKDEEYRVRIWDSPAIEPGLDSNDNLHTTIANYLQVITHWHYISNEIIKYITTIPSPPSPYPPTTPKTVALSKAVTTDAAEEKDKEKARERDKEKHKRKDDSGGDGSSKPSSALSETPSDAKSTPDPHFLPIALVPCYQLTVADTGASLIPITDAYSPFDHWQWMATLWRGIVGPDLTIVVRPEESGEKASPREGGGDRRQWEIDNKLDEAKTMVLRADREGKVSGAQLRRVAFEVGEFVRFGFGR